MAKIYNLARMTTATVGTGTITLGSAISGYLTLALAGVTSGDVISYGVKDGANSEVGYGVATDTAGTWTLTRNVTKSTNSNNAISLSGTAEVFTTIRAEDIRLSVVIQTFTASGTYTPTSGMIYAQIECWGGGGGGGGTASATASVGSGGGGGGAGSYSLKISTAAAVGASQTVTIGAAGTAGSAGNNAGGNGGDTSVGSLCIGKGGGGGGGSAGSGSITVGAGGVAGTGDVTGTGMHGMGQPAILNAQGVGGGGGSATPVGAGAPAQMTATTITGSAASGRASGGGGGASFNAGGAAGGGAGTAGYVKITEFVIA